MLTKIAFAGIGKDGHQIGALGKVRRHPETGGQGGPARAADEEGQVTGGPAHIVEGRVVFNRLDTGDRHVLEEGGHKFHPNSLGPVGVLGSAIQDRPRRFNDVVFQLGVGRLEGLGRSRKGSPTTGPRHESREWAASQVAEDLLS